MNLQRRAGRGRRVVAPETVDDRVNAHDPIGLEQQDGEERARCFWLLMRTTSPWCRTSTGPSTPNSHPLMTTTSPAIGATSLQHARA